MEANASPTLAKFEKDLATEAWEVQETLLSRYFDKIGHIIIGMVVAWTIGLFGLHFSWILALIYLIYKIDKRRHVRESKRHLREIHKASIEAKKRRKALFSSKEKAIWLNTFIQKVWPKVGPMLEEQTKETVRVTVQQTLEDLKPPMVKGVALSKISFGNTPPQFSSMRTHPGLPPSVYKLDFDFSYTGELDLVVDVKTSVVTVPIAVSELEINAVVHIRLDLCDQSPYVHTIHVKFSDPKVDLAVKPLKAFDIFDVSVIRNWFSETISTALKNTVIDYDMIADGQKYDNDTNGDTIEPGKGITPKNSSGIVWINLIGAHHLPVADKSGTSDPFCKVTYGKQSFETQVIQKDLNPQWNQTVEFFVDTSSPKKYTVIVYDWDRFSGNDFLGEAEIDFSELQDEEKEELYLPLKDKKGKVIDSAEIHVKTTFYKVQHETG